MRNKGTRRMAKTTTELFMFALIIIVILDKVASQRGSFYWDCPTMLESCELLKGIMGRKGENGPRGSSGTLGPTGVPGLPGDPGDPGYTRGGPIINAFKGSKGDRGAPGIKGAEGDRGLPGGPGDRGVVGVSNSKGEPGPKGIAGVPGVQGPPGDSLGFTTMNWKQCAFTLDLNKQTGVIHECDFRKTGRGTSLHVTYQGDTQIGLCGTCCKQWNFLFDGEACSSPGPIEATYSGLMLVNNDQPNVLPVFRHGTISGYCNGIPSGMVRVGLGLTNCAKYPSDMILVSAQEKATGRFIIEEVQSPQA